MAQGNYLEELPHFLVQPGQLVDSPYPLDLVKFQDALAVLIFEPKIFQEIFEVYFLANRLQPAEQGRDLHSIHHRESRDGFLNPLNKLPSRN